jgi:hypothetical protein
MKGFLTGLIMLYGITANAQDLTKLYRYHNPATGGHFYTINWEEIGYGQYGFQYENVAAMVYPAAVTGTVPVYRYFNRNTRCHFYTTNWNELGNGKSGFNYEGIAFYAYPAKEKGTVPLYRYYHQRNNNHFFTASFEELGKGRDGYRSEGIACYIFKADSSDQLTVPPPTELMDMPGRQIQFSTDPLPDGKMPEVQSADAPKNDYFILFDNTTRYTSFLPEWKTALFNQVVAVFNNNQPLMLIMLPANGGHSPEPGVYNIAEGSKRAVKKGSGLAKLEFEPGYVSAEGGTLTITEHDGIFSFAAKDVTIINSKTKESKKLTFTISMFIEKK